MVVVDADAAHLYGDLLPPRRSPARPARRLRRATPSLSGFVLLLALRGRTPGLAHHTVLFPADYDAEFDAVFGRRRPAGRRPDRLRQRARRPGAAARRRPRVVVRAGQRAAARPGPRAVDWDAPGLADAYADRVLDVLAARGLDVRDRVLWREVRTPADLERDTGCARRRDLRHVVATAPGRRSCGRPTRSPVPGLFLVGGSAHPGGGLPLVGLSAAIVAGLVGPA